MFVLCSSLRIPDPYLLKDPRALSSGDLGSLGFLLTCLGTDSHTSLSICPTLLPMLCLQVHSLCLHLYSCPANRLVLLYSIYMLIHNIFFTEGSQEGSFKCILFPDHLFLSSDCYESLMCIFHLYSLKKSQSITGRFISALAILLTSSTSCFEVSCNFWSLKLF